MLVEIIQNLSSITKRKCLENSFLRSWKTPCNDLVLEICVTVCLIPLSNFQGVIIGITNACYIKDAWKRTLSVASAVMSLVCLITYVTDLMAFVFRTLMRWDRVMRLVSSVLSCNSCSITSQNWFDSGLCLSWPEPVFVVVVSEWKAEGKK